MGLGLTPNSGTGPAALPPPVATFAQRNQGMAGTTRQTRGRQPTAIHVWRALPRRTPCSSKSAVPAYSFRPSRPSDQPITT